MDTVRRTSNSSEMFPDAVLKRGKGDTGGHCLDHPMPDAAGFSRESACTYILYHSYTNIISVNAQKKSRVPSLP